jgi:long-chain fatty acid transport protein
MARSGQRLALGLGAFLAAAAADASWFGRFQHGGRATAQAGAFVARADDPAAVGYNPAALARLPASGLQVGLDFDAPTLDSESPTGSARAEHSIQFPPALYYAWRPDGGPWAFAAGLDSPLWRFNDWRTRLFPARSVARRSEARLFELRAAAARTLGEHWSLGGALRYVQGEVAYGDSRRLEVEAPTGAFDVEIDRVAEADADGAGFELAAHYAAPRWGFGVTWESEVELEGDGDLAYVVADPEQVPAEVAAIARAALPTGASTLGEGLPETLTAGVWFAASDALRLELDAALARWSSAPEASASHEPGRLGPGFELGRRAGWDDALSLRLGAEWTLSETWSLGAGLAFEPSPAHGDAVEPGMPVGDVTVVSLGGSASLGWLTFDLGWSYHASDDLSARDQEADPGIVTTYSAHAQVWSLSARWRL